MQHVHKMVWVHPDWTQMDLGSPGLDPDGIRMYLNVSSPVTEVE